MDARSRSLSLALLLMLCLVQRVGYVQVQIQIQVCAPDYPPARHSSDIVVVSQFLPSFFFPLHASKQLPEFHQRSGTENKHLTYLPTSQSLPAQTRGRAAQLLYSILLAPSFISWGRPHWPSLS